MAMSKGLLALEELLSRMPSGADYDTVLAAIMASEGGRWFLSEFADRNRHADTNVLVGALARVEAAIRGEPEPQTAERVQAEAAPSPVAPEPSAQPELAVPQVVPASQMAAPVLCRDLIEIGSAVDRIEALVNGELPAADGAGALERIRDIAFALRAREFESALCDALEYSARSISEILEFSDSTAQRGRTASELLHDLAGRIKELIELSIAAQKAKPPASLDVAVPAIETATAVVAAPIDATLKATEHPVAAVAETAEVVAAEPAGYRSADVPLSAVADEATAVAAGNALEARSQDLREVAEIEEPAAATDVARTVAPGPEAATYIDEDPGDLFEPAPISGALYSLPVQTTVIMVAPIAPIQSAPRLALNRPTIMTNRNQVDARFGAGQQARATAASAAAEVGAHPASEPPVAVPPELAAEVSVGPLADTLPRANDGIASIAPEIPHQESSDPLAPIRALREEELIALFS
jgi:hypothetical protein